MFAHELPSYFANIGARLVVRDEAMRFTAAARPFTLNIDQDHRGEHFVLNVRQDAQDFRVLQQRRDERHLLLYAAGSRQGTNRAAERFLCGHDERHWFVAAVAEPVSTVIAARRSLLPRELRHTGLHQTTIATRHNEVFKRQGEWFFIPVTDQCLLDQINQLPIHRNEPIQRGRSKPHRCDELVRVGGVFVYLARGQEYSAAQWEAMHPTERAKLSRVETRMKDMTVYVRGPIRHPDHATLILPGWHRVLLNGEIASRNVTFYD